MVKSVFIGDTSKSHCLSRGKHGSSDDGQALDQCFPDVLVDAFLQESGKITPEMVQAHQEKPEDFDLLTNGLAVPLRPIPVSEAKDLITTALASFSPALGQQASDILNDSERLNLHEVPVGQGGMMRVRPAGLTMDAADEMRLDNAGLSKDFLNDLRTRYLDDENAESNKAMIDFDYNGTIGAVVYLAHELGHAMADDAQNNAGHSYRDNPEHMIETQAYLVQNIVLSSLQTHSDQAIAQAAQRFGAADMARNMYDLQLSGIAEKALKTASENKSVQPAHLFESHFGQDWDHFIQSYPPAQNVFEAVCVVAENGLNASQGCQILQGQSERMHFRSASYMTGAALAHHLTGQNISTRTSVTQAVFGGQGPKNMDDVLSQTQMTQMPSLARLANKTVRHGVAPLTGQMSANISHNAKKSPSFTA